MNEVMYEELSVDRSASPEPTLVHIERELGRDLTNLNFSRRENITEKTAVLPTMLERVKQRHRPNIITTEE
jgi:hypothetical protein